jgi:hypothetical protein
VYAIGSGEPLLLMPYSHAATVIGDRTLTELANFLEKLSEK